jgi:BMFP domain-containing protein YqiC
MTDSPENPPESLLSRLEEVLGELSPEPLRQRLEPVMEGFLEQFQLVSRRDYEAHLKNLERLERRIAELEARIAELERDD